MLAEILGLKELKQSDMKSIKEKAEELYRIPRGDDTEDTVALDLDKAVTFTEGAYYVLEQVENILQDKNTGLVEMWDELMTLVEQLKSNQ